MGPDDQMSLQVVLNIWTPKVGPVMLAGDVGEDRESFRSEAWRRWRPTVGL